MNGFFCPQCGQPVEPEAKFCSECGSETGQPVSAATPPAQSPEASGQTDTLAPQTRRQPSVSPPAEKDRRLRLLAITAVLLVVIPSAVVGGFLWGRKDATEATGSATPQVDLQKNEVKIGDQVWMAKNLDVSTFRNGDPIPEAKTDAEWAAAGDAGIPAWSYYENDPANGKTYGKLYNWYAVSDSRGLCPQSWHVSTDTEWSTLVGYLGSTDSAGGKLKEAGTAHWESPNKDATNSSSFSALPGGLRNSFGDFNGLGILAYFWTANRDHISNGRYASFRIMSHGSSSATPSSYYMEQGHSVRCVKD